MCVSVCGICTCLCLYTNVATPKIATCRIYRTYTCTLMCFQVLVKSRLRKTAPVSSICLILPGPLDFYNSQPAGGWAFRLPHVTLLSSDSHMATLETTLSLAARDQDPPPPHSAVLPTVFIFNLNNVCVAEAERTRQPFDFPGCSL